MDDVSNVEFEESFGRGEDGFGDSMGDSEVCFFITVIFIFNSSMVFFCIVFMIIIENYVER